MSDMTNPDPNHTAATALGELPRIGDCFVYQWGGRRGKVHIINSPGIYDGHIAAYCGYDACCADDGATRGDIAKQGYCKQCLRKFGKRGEAG